MAATASGELVFVNTLFSCLAIFSPRHSFIPPWQPKFISRLAPEDRCHLNGLTLRDGRPAFVTAVSESDVADGWRDARRDGGDPARTGKTDRGTSAAGRGNPDPAPPPPSGRHARGLVTEDGRR